MILLSDGYLANGAEPWLVPDVDSLPTIEPRFSTSPNDIDEEGQPVFHPYLRDPETLAREWAIPGTPGLMHRIGGIEKEDVTGNISYEPDNHERMVQLRAAKVAGIADDIPEVEVEGDVDADVLVLGWGSTWGAIGAAGRPGAGHRRQGRPGPPGAPQPVAPQPGRGPRKGRALPVHLGQLTKVIRAEFLVDAQCVSKVQGQPFTVGELVARDRARVSAASGEAGSL